MTTAEKVSRRKLSLLDLAADSSMKSVVTIRRMAQLAWLIGYPVPEVHILIV